MTKITKRIAVTAMSGTPRLVKTAKGFTMIELSLSMAIIGVMSVTMMMMISNAVSAYHKGLTLNQLNTVGMGLVEDIRVSIQNSPARAVSDECATMYAPGQNAEPEAQAKCVADHAASLVTQLRRGTVTAVDKNTYEDIPLSGIFCTGRYTYIWNSGYLVAGGTGAKSISLTYKTDTGDVQTIENARLLKIHDEGRMICKTTAGYRPYGYKEAGVEVKANYIKSDENPLAKIKNDNIDISGITTLDSDPEDLLEDNGGLAVYDFEVTQPATVENLDVMFYAASMILGTLRGGPNITAGGDTCAPPSDLANSDFDYCAINKFNFAARAVGGASAK